MIYYECIAGSRAYGLELEGSDIDVCRIADSWSTTGHDGEKHIIQVPREEFVDRAVLQRETPLYIQWWFPFEINTPGALSEYLTENRESVVRASKNAYGNCILERHTAYLSTQSTITPAFQRDLRTAPTTTTCCRNTQRESRSQTLFAQAAICAKRLLQCEKMNCH